MICWTCFGARAKEPRSHRKWREARRRRGGLVLWWFATDAKRQPGPDRFLPSSLSFAGVSHREQRILRRLLLILAVSAAGSGSGSDSSPVGLKDAGGEVELDKRSTPGHGPQEVMLFPGKELMLCKSYHQARPSGWRVAPWSQTERPPPLWRLLVVFWRWPLQRCKYPVPCPRTCSSTTTGGH